MLLNAPGTQKKERNNREKCNFYLFILCGPWLFWFIWIMAATAKDVEFSEAQGDILTVLSINLVDKNPKTVHYDR